MSSRSTVPEDMEKGDVVDLQPVKVKHQWTIFDPFHRHPPTPAPATMEDANEIPLAKASFISKLGFFWIQPMLVQGYKKTLVAEDLWKMDRTRESGFLANKFESNFARRKTEVEEWNTALADGSMRPSSLRKLWWKTSHKVTGFGSADGTRTIGIALALSDTFAWSFWSAGIFKVVADLASVCSPLLTRQIIYFVTDAANAHANVPGFTEPHVGRGVGLAIGLFCLQAIYSLGTAQTFSRSGQAGVLARGALISAVYRRAMVLSGKSRVSLTNSKLVNHISTDISRIDFASSFFHFSWTCIFQLIEVIIILLVNLGVSSLAGIALVAVIMPIQTQALRKLYQLRRQSMVFTDKRIRLVSELLGGIRLLKTFSWEIPYAQKVHDFRTQELVGIRHLLVIRAATQALALSVPTLASILVFVTYSLTGHVQNPALIWTALSLLNLLRMPLMLLPNSLSTIVDAHNACQRLVSVFTCETLDNHFLIDLDNKDAVVVDKASFVWESSENPLTENPTKSKRKEAIAKPEVVRNLGPPSELREISLRIPRGALWVICGPVGSGKSSLLQGLIGEMRKTTGTVVFGGTISYCSQSAWIMNATVRENILFGRPFDDKRYAECVRNACLLPDLEMLPHGDMTEIGEKGISLSGGQRQRVSICRTLYYNSEIILLDDIFSALDAHVGRHIMNEVVLKGLAGKTRILVTHAVHFMSSADNIICLDAGRIVEQGSYAKLLAAKGTFARLAADYGGSRDEDAVKMLKLAEAGKPVLLERTEATPNAGIMQKEDIVQGGFSKNVYRDYLRAAKGYINVPILIATLTIQQGAQVLSQFDLTWWQDGNWGRGDGFYMGLYAALGLASAIFVFISGSVVVHIGSTASRTLHREAFSSILAAPISFFDTTPIGRILNRFTKDIDSIDNRMIDSARMVLVTGGQIVGSFILIAIVQQYFIIAIAAALVGYWSLSRFYNASSREIKRLDNVLRSSLYAHFSESLSGLSTVRAFGEVERFVKHTEQLIDLENRAYLLTVINQRWLAVRIDFLGACLTFVVAIIAILDRHKLNASMIGLVLSSILAIQQALSMVIRQAAEVQNNLGSVERLQHYAVDIEQEAPSEIPSTQPPADWPSQGAIEFKDVVLNYRPGLPNVLHGLSIKVNPGEKVGVVGRTGAGKSSLMLCLFRIVELSSGSILVDGIDIKTLGLRDLRTRLSIIPQEPLLFNGTLRSNLDPFGLATDDVLWAALKRASLVERTGSGGKNEDQHSRFTLDTAVDDEGLNMSVGERSLVSLARALVKDSQIVILDECTAAVDFETDSKIQRTIMTEFKSKTLLCIAHRLNTIIGYDRVLVLDKGNVSAFDKPTTLFTEGGVFHGLCVQSGIELDDIIAAQRLMQKPTSLEA